MFSRTLLQPRAKYANAPTLAAIVCQPRKNEPTILLCPSKTTSGLFFLHHSGGVILNSVTFWQTRTTGIGEPYSVRPVPDPVSWSQNPLAS